MQAVILAAGMGRRLGSLTENNTKCMVELNGVRLIDRLLSSLEKFGVTNIVVVVGYKAENVRLHINSKWNHLNVTFVENKDFYKTNNVYSLYLAKDFLLQSDTLLLESDLVFDEEILKNLILDKRKNIAVVSKYQDWMDGTVVSIKNNQIESFILKTDQLGENLNKLFKTVNIYKFSKEFCKEVYVPVLEAYCGSDKLNSYYEEALSIISKIDSCVLGALDTNDLPWYEIDNMNDYWIAETMFLENNKKHDGYLLRHGGYWRFPKLLDYCYLVNPYFPTKKMLSEISSESDILLSNYPSNLEVINRIASVAFNVREQYISVGNGASEIISILLKNIKSSKIAIFYPSFDEYFNRCLQNNSKVTHVDSFKMSDEKVLSVLKELSQTNDYIIFVNPENPTGRMIDPEALRGILPYMESNNCILILDESFVDFSGLGKKSTMITNEVLEKNKNLVIIKSISKSYGVPGLRLGMIASANTEILKNVIVEQPIWNINSYAEKFLEKLINNADEYWTSCEELVEARNIFAENLVSCGAKVHDSKANFLLIEVIKNNNFLSFEEFMLKNNILVKNLKNKKGILSQNMFRIAIKDKKSNDYFCKILKSFMMDGSKQI
jgi:histidinol-phosphate/aromatic aminotransferase/cobyric acid decarboxylase-like protein/choline kinase